MTGTFFDNRFFEFPHNTELVIPGEDEYLWFFVDNSFGLRVVDLLELLTDMNEVLNQVEETIRLKNVSYVNIQPYWDIKIVS